MNHKIIGFAVGSLDRGDLDNNSKIDVFKVGLNSKFLIHKNFFIHLWGIGELENCMIKESIFSLSFPLHSSLEDRNVIITLSPEGITIENDWLGSIPVFYNIEHKVVSTLINQVIDGSNMEIDNEGFNNFLNFGYSVLERTPLKNVRFLRYYSKITINDDEILVEYKPDPVIGVKYGYSENQVFDLIKEYVENGEKRVRNEIIIPTSGGYDSRLLNYFIQDKQRIRAFTYGTSPMQSESYEVIYAQKLCEILNIKWQQIDLGNFNGFIPEWFQIFGYSTHLHGMYQIEFYNKIKKNNFSNPTLLSGIIGDAWAGSIKVMDLKCPQDLFQLGYTHGLNSDSKYSKLESVMKPWIEFYSQNRQLLNSYYYQIIFCMRLKIILLSYLLSIPEYFGMACWSPFLDMRIALSMLGLPVARRTERRWQTDFYKREGLFLECMNLKCSKENTLNLQGLRQTGLEPLDVNILSKYIYEDYLDSINSDLKL